MMPGSHIYSTLRENFIFQAKFDFIVFHNVHGAAYVHAKAYNRIRRTARTFPPFELFSFPDSRSRYMVLESFQGAGFVIFRAKIEAKSVCKVPSDFPRFFVRFRALRYYLDNIASPHCYVASFFKNFFRWNSLKSKKTQKCLRHVDKKCFKYFTTVAQKRFRQRR